MIKIQNKNLEGNMRIEYPSGMWSEREGSLLKWGKGSVTKSARFAPNDKIEDVQGPVIVDAIRKSGQKPEQFCSVGSTIAARTLIPEIEACIAYAKAEKEAREMQQWAEWQIAIEDGVAFRTAEITEQYGSELHWARKSTPDDGFANWVVIGFAGSPRVKVSERAVRDVVGTRKSVGAFPGCSNTAWEISEAEWDEIIKLSGEIAEKQAETRKAFEQAVKADIQHKISTGYCFYCETWCEGDCGHYSNDPMIKFRRDINQAQREQNYGINEG
jgi:hypothetical protein